MNNITEQFKKFFRMEASAGILLIIFAALALVVANSPLYAWYDYVLHDIYFQLGFVDKYTKDGFDLQLNKSVLHWVNDGLMVIFFFLIGLEIKREVVEGDLSTKDKAMLPVLAAIGGMAVPSIIFYSINMNILENVRGWAIPAATDIAFALGILTLAGRGAPLSLKILLTAIAVIDDLGAIIIIALFYSVDLALEPLIIAAFAIGGLFVLNRLRISDIVPYLMLGFVLWISIYESGIHATLAGVITAMFIPLRCPKENDYSPVKTLEAALHPWVAFMILPLFAFANAGVPFKGMGLDSFSNPLTLGIILGLFVGKQIGIFGTIFFAVKIGLCAMPKGANWLQIYAVSLLCGIGFTMSLFIGGLAFLDLEQQAAVRLGVLSGSILSATAAFIVFRICDKRDRAVQQSYAGGTGPAH